jgi:hypothetical protein
MIGFLVAGFVIAALARLIKPVQQNLSVLHPPTWAAPASPPEAYASSRGTKLLAVDVALPAQRPVGEGATHASEKYRR